MAVSEILRGRYRLCSEISRGGMGVVYLADDLLTGRRVAVKKSFFSGQIQSKQGFEIEAKLLARLRHPGLPKVIDYFVADGKVQTLVMDFVPGDTLLDTLESGLLRRGCAVDPEHVMSWALQILDILRYLHGFKPPVIHRDIKPNNIKLTENGRVMLLDFGLAKGSEATVVGGMSGYSPIEQVNRSGTDPRSDIYALGTTLFHLLTNRYPLTALDRFRHVFDTREPGNIPVADPQISVAEINPMVPEEISDVVMKAMALMPENRFQFADHMKAAILEILDEHWMEGIALPADSFHQEQVISNSEPLFVDNESSLGEWHKTDVRQESAPNLLSETDLPVAHATPNASAASGDPKGHSSVSPAVTVASVTPGTGQIDSQNMSQDYDQPRIGKRPIASPFTGQAVVAETKPPTRIMLLRIPIAASFAAVLVAIVLVASYRIADWASVGPQSIQVESAAANPSVTLPDRSTEDQIGIIKYTVRNENSLVPMPMEYRFAINEKFKFGITAKLDGFLYVVSRDSNRNASLAYPSPSQTLLNAVRENAETVFPQDSAFQLRENSPAETWVYFVVVPSRDDQLAGRIIATLSFDVERSLSAPAVSELFELLDKIAAPSEIAEGVRVRRIIIERR